MIVRILIWSLYDSRTTIDKLRESLPELVEQHVDLERGKHRDDPDVCEKFDVL